MTTAIHLAGAADLDRVLALAERCDDERGTARDDAERRRAIAPLLDGTPLGAIWLIGPQRAPLGFVLVGFGWSAALGGPDGWVQEVFIRPSVRRRGIGTEVLHAIAVALTRGGLRALHVRLPQADATTAAFCARVGFRAQADDRIMTDFL